MFLVSNGDYYFCGTYGLKCLSREGAVTEMFVVVSLYAETLMRSPWVPQGYLYCSLDTLT
jgi:hypothetical protein